jgi:predicted nucleotidyltransferase
MVYLRGTIARMTRGDILSAIRSNEEELRRLQVRELALFGSFARGEETETSDIDFYVESR